MTYWYKADLIHLSIWETGTQTQNKHTDNKWENTSKALENIVFLKVACLTGSLINKMEYIKIELYRYKAKKKKNACPFNL